jgi:hypothetical protein
MHISKPRWRKKKDVSLKKFASFSLLTLGCLLALLLSACSGPTLPNTASQSLLTSTSSQNKQAANITTACPAAGTGRAAVMPSLTLGAHPTLVYVFNQFDSRGQPTASALKRYDTLSKSTTTILTLAKKNMHSAQVSADGQWILFQTQASQQTKLELIRLDGRYQQTLYCSNSGINGVQWSTTQKLIAVSQNNSANMETIDLLNTTSGTVQTELSVPLTNFTGALNLRTWLDTTRIYLTNTQVDQPPNIIYLLDTSKGPNQQVSDLQVVFNGSFNDFDSSYNAAQLFVNSCSCGQGGFSGPSAITVRPATGGSAQTLYATANYAITSVRAVTASTLLFTIDNFAVLGQTDTSQNGLWKMQSNGSGLTRLITDSSGAGSSFNQFSQFPWSNVSRDSALYSLQVVGNMTQSINVGSLSGGAPSSIASSSSGVSLDVAGWTKM